MKFGIYAPMQHINMPEELLTKTFEEMNDGAAEDLVDPAFKAALDSVKLADDIGFDLTLVAQRFLGPDLEAWILSGALASVTKNIRIMTAVHPGLWNPQIAAKMGASIDRISCGRFAVNLVAGWNQKEHEMFGGTTLKDDEVARYERAEEFVTIVKKMWTEPVVNYDGKYFRVNDATLLLKPVSGRLPEFFGAARSERGRECIAKTCEWWFLPYPNNFRTVDENMQKAKEAMENMRERAAKYGRTLKYAINAFVIVRDTYEEAAAEAERIERHGQSGDRINAIHSHGLGTGLIGTPEQIAEQVQKLEEMGLDLILTKFTPSLEALQRFAEDVMPLLPTKSDAEKVG